MLAHANLYTSVAALARTKRRARALPHLPTRAVSFRGPVFLRFIVEELVSGAPAEVGVGPPLRGPASMLGLPPLTLRRLSRPCRFVREEVVVVSSSLLRPSSAVRYLVTECRNCFITVTPCHRAGCEGYRSSVDH